MSDKISEREWLYHVQGWELRRKTALNDLMLTILDSSLDPQRKHAMSDLVVEFVKAKAEQVAPI